MRVSERFTKAESDATRLGASVVEGAFGAVSQPPYRLGSDTRLVLSDAPSSIDDIYNNRPQQSDALGRVRLRSRYLSPHRGVRLLKTRWRCRRAQNAPYCVAMMISVPMVGGNPASPRQQSKCRSVRPTFASRVSGPSPPETGPANNVVPVGAVPAERQAAISAR